MDFSGVHISFRVRKKPQPKGGAMHRPRVVALIFVFYSNGSSNVGMLAVFIWIRVASVIEMSPSLS